MLVDVRVALSARPKIPVIRDSFVLRALGGAPKSTTHCSFLHIAIVFHQFFEGLGLGARIATLIYPEGGSWKKWLMCFLYTVITPVGIAIVRSLSLAGKQDPY